MRTTLNLPDNLLFEAQKITNIKSKTEIIIYALENLVKREKIQKIKLYKGKIRLDINLDDLRQR